MAERTNINPALLSQLSQEKPLVKIGHYVLGETLGVGTFGKVKSISMPFCFDKLIIVKKNFICCIISWRAPVDWT